MKSVLLAGLCGLTLMSGCAGLRPKPAVDSEGVPRFAHVFVIIDENKDYEQILDPVGAPNISRLAATGGNAVRFYAEVHPSEANYVALLGGDTFGIHDDDAYYCHANATAAYCDGAKAPGYADHTVRAPHLGDQLAAAGLSWKGYYESLPEPGSPAVTAGDPKVDTRTRSTALYASKHSGFMNFADVQADPRRAEHIVGFDRFEQDLAANTVPSFALVVPNQCNDMHGLHGEGVPADCDIVNKADLIRRGDLYMGRLVERIEHAPVWSSKENVAIVITFDEGSGRSREGCCGITPNAASNYGGGHIPTVVITNHGRGALTDDTPYSHYSLLRTLEDAFRLPGRLGHAADADVTPMRKLFAVEP